MAKEFGRPQRVAQEMQKEIRSEKKRSKELERELLRKERALAETAAAAGWLRWATSSA